MIVFEKIIKIFYRYFIINSVHYGDIFFRSNDENKTQKKRQQLIYHRYIVRVLREKKIFIISTNMDGQITTEQTYPNISLLSTTQGEKNVRF